MVAFVILAVLLVAAGVGVVTLRQPVHAALSLVGAILLLAAIYVTLEAHFLAAIQVIVYAGAIVVLFLFVIMLLNVGRYPSPSLTWLRPTAWITGLLSLVGVVAVVFAVQQPLPDFEVISAALRGGNADAVGEALFSEHLLSFHLVGVLLLVGVISAVALVQQGTRQMEGATPSVAEPTTAGAPGRAVPVAEEG